MVASSDLVWLQGGVDILVGIFNQVGPKKNIGKTVRMVFCPCQAAGTQSEAAYDRWMTVEGISFRERQRVGVECLECG